MEAFKGFGGKQFTANKTTLPQSMPAAVLTWCASESKESISHKLHPLIIPLFSSYNPPDVGSTCCPKRQSLADAVSV